MKYALTLHRSNVYDRQILADLLQNFIHEISRDCFAVQYIVSWTRVSRYDETRDLVTPLMGTCFLCSTNSNFMSVIIEDILFLFVFLQRTIKFCKELRKIVPSCDLKYRRGLELKKIIPQAISKGYTDLLVINEDQNKPSILVATVSF